MTRLILLVIILTALVGCGDDGYTHWYEMDLGGFESGISVSEYYSQDPDDWYDIDTIGNDVFYMRHWIWQNARPVERGKFYGPVIVDTITAGYIPETNRYDTIYVDTARYYAVVDTVGYWVYGPYTNGAFVHCEERCRALITSLDSVVVALDTTWLPKIPVNKGRR